MKPRATLWGLLIVGTAVVLLPGTAADASKRSPSILADVRELDRPVTYTETKIPLGELVQKVASDTGVPLTAARGVADEPVAVVVRQRPARGLLEELAEFFDYRWRRWGREGRWRYEIEQDLAARRREQALRDAALADVERRLRQEVRRLSEMAVLSQEQIQAILDTEEQRRRGLQRPRPPLGGGARPGAGARASQREADRGSPEEEERRRRFSMAVRLKSPIARLLGQFLGRLTPQHWAVLRAKPGRITFSTVGQPGELPLPAEMARALRASRPRHYLSLMGVSSDDPEADEETRQLEGEMQEEWAAAAGYRVVIQLQSDPSRFRTGGALQFNAEVTPIAPGPPSESSFSEADMDTSVSLVVEPEDGQQAAGEKATRPRAGPEQDLLCTPRRFQPEGRSHTDPRGWGNARAWRLWELLPDLARTYGVDCIADAYWNAPSISATELSPAEPVELATLLERLTDPTHRWDCRGGGEPGARGAGARVVRLRSRTWFFDRLREVPLRSIRRWKAIYDARGALPLEEYLAIVTTLSDEQLASLKYLVGETGLPWELAEVYRARDALRLYAAMSPAPKTIPLTILSPF